MTTPRPVAVAITGGIGAGKSELLRAFARHGAATISSDDIVHSLLREDGEVKRAIVERSNGPELVLGANYRYGLGFMLTLPAHPFGPSPRAFGHTGAGGSLGFADPDAKVGFAYTMNKMGTFSGLEDPRWPPLVEALYAAL